MTAHEYKNLIDGNVDVIFAAEPSEDDYAYAVDVDENKAKLEEEALNSKNINEDDFFNDFDGDDDLRFGDDDLLGMVDEISQDILNEEEENVVKAEQEESLANQSMLDKYSIDSYFDDEINEILDQGIKKSKQMAEEKYELMKIRMGITRKPLDNN